MQVQEVKKNPNKQTNVRYNYCALKFSVPKFKTQHVQGDKKHDGHVTQHPTLLLQNTYIIYKSTDLHPTDSK